MHQCEAAIIACEDYRLHQRKDGRNYVAEYIRSLDVDCDLITRAGGVQDLVRPTGPGFADPVIRDLYVSHKLHNANMLIFLNHQDCGAYAGFGFKTADEEIRRHLRDIRRTLKMLHLMFPTKWLIGSFAELAPETTDVFTIKKIVEIKLSMRRIKKP